MKKIKDYLSEDWQSYDYNQLKEAAVRIQAEANKRFSVQKRQTYKSPAYMQAYKSGGRFNITKQPSYNDMKKEYARAVRYLNNQTSTQEGFKKAKRDIIRELKKKDVVVTQRQFDKFFDIYSELRESDPIAKMYQYKYDVFEMITDELKDKTDFDAIVLAVSERVNALYRERTRQNDQFETDLSAYFRK